MNELNRIRNIQIVASKFLEIAPELKITQANSDVVDFYVQTPIDRARFGVVVLEDDFVRSKDMDGFCFLLASKHLHKEVNGLPIMVAVFCPENCVKIDFLLTWDYQDCAINENLTLKELDRSRLGDLIAEVRKQTHDIDVMDPQNVRVVKSIALMEDRNGNKCSAEFIYARKLSDDYRMNKFEPQTEAERFKYNLNGPYETEFPCDLLDEAILNAVKTIYPKACFRSRLLLCTSEYRSLLRYRNYFKDYAEIRLLPDISKIPIDVLPLLGTVEGLRVRIDIYMLLRHPRNAYSNEGFELRFPFENWLSTLTELSKDLSSFENVSKLIERT